MMVKVRLTQYMAGATRDYKPGDVISVDRKTAQSLIAAGSAEPVRRGKERATSKQREVAATRG